MFLAEYSGKTFAFAIRYVVDLLNGVPSIVIGIVAYALVVRPMHHFSALAGGTALGIMMIPIAVRTTEEFLRSVPTQHPRRRNGTRRHQSDNHIYCGHTRCYFGTYFRHDAQSGARGG